MGGRSQSAPPTLSIGLGKPGRFRAKGGLKRALGAALKRDRSILDLSSASGPIPEEKILVPNPNPRQSELGRDQSKEQQANPPCHSIA